MSKFKECLQCDTAWCKPVGECAREHDKQCEPMTAPDELKVTQAVLWSFDDHHIGLALPSNQVLSERLVKRPNGFTQHDWYAFAGAICRESNIRKSTATDALLRDAYALLKRYRDETPPGHSPHMICGEVDATLSRIRQQIGE